MMDALHALAALTQALDVAADDPAAQGARSLDALVAGTRAVGGRFSTDRSQISVGSTSAAVRRLELTSRGVTLGQLELYYADGHGPSEEEERYLEVAVRAIAVALHQAKLLAEVRFLLAGLEERVRERTEQAVRAERMVALGTLAQGVVAELERPLGAVHANLRAIIEEIDQESARAHGRAPLPRKLADHVREVATDCFLDVERLARMAQDLRRIAPGETGAMVRVDLNLLVQSALNLARHRFRKAAEVQTDFGTLPEISCHPDRMVQAFANLLVNAAEAVRGAGEIFVRTQRRGEQVVLEFSDTGVGIPEEELARIFEPFYTTKRGGEAAGLGLAIVREVVREHGGEVFVESQPGEGTRFEIVLPVG
jgi:signal transduction histidine kinase